MTEIAPDARDAPADVRWAYRPPAYGTRGRLGRPPTGRFGVAVAACAATLGFAAPAIEGVEPTTMEPATGALTVVPPDLVEQEGGAIRAIRPVDDGLWTVLRVLGRFLIGHGLPERVRSGNAPGFIAGTARARPARLEVGPLSVEQGHLGDKARVEILHSRPRDELLNAPILHSLIEARVSNEMWRQAFTRDGLTVTSVAATGATAGDKRRADRQRWST